MTTFTPSLRLWQGTPGDPAIRNAWGTWLNENDTLVESAVTDTASINIAGLTTYTLTVANGASDQARPLVQSFTGALTGDCTVTLPAVPKIGWAINGTTGSHNVILTTGSGATATIPPGGQWWWYSCDGTNVSLPGVGYGNVTSPGGLVSSGFDAGGANVRMVGGSYGAFWRNDGSNTYLLLTASGSQYGSFNGLRPITINDATGAVSLDDTGAGTFLGGNVTVAGGMTTGNLGVSGNTTTDGITSFGTGGGFYINPNNAGNQLINFASSQYLEFVPGDGFTLNTTGNIHLNGGVTVNGVGLCYNNGGTYAINITGVSGGCPWGGISGIPALCYDNGATYAINITGTAGAVAWGNVTGKPYAFNQSTDVGASPTFGIINTTGGSGATGSGSFLNNSGVQTGGWTFGMGVIVNSSSGVLAAGFFTYSDRRLKSDIRDLSAEDGIAWVKSGRPRRYTMAGKPSAGFIAQEELEAGQRAEAVLSIPTDDPAFAEGDGYAAPGHRLSRDYEHDIAYLTAALKAALTRIENLEQICRSAR